MKWIVATNLREDCRGALEYAAWVRTHARDPGAHTITALSVLRDAAGLFGGPDPGPALAQVEKATKTFVAASAASEAISSIRVESANDVATTLCEAAEKDNATLLLGRKAPRENTSLVRLGPIARRTLRQLRGPTVIVPTDWTVANAGTGPVMVAVDASEPSLAALSYAQTLATAVGRPLLAVQAVRGVGGLGVALLEAEEYVKVRERYREEQTHELRTYLAKHGRGSIPVRSEMGATVSVLRNVAEEESAAMIVCGSRRLTRTERLFSASVGSELAAFAEVPVAVVPPDFGP